MATKNGLNWNSGIEKITSLTHGKKVKADPKSNKIISDALNYIFTSAIENLKEKKLVNASVEDIHEAIKKILPSSMSDHAIGESLRQIFFWGTEPFDFVSKKKSKEDIRLKLLERMKKQDEAELKRSFMKGVKGVLEDSHSDARLDKNSHLYICKLLDNISDDMIKKLNVKNVDKLTLDEARKVTKDILPKELLPHASAEGSKMLYKFESRGLEFVPGASIHQRIQEKHLARRHVGHHRGFHELTREEANKLAASGDDFKPGVMSILQQTHADLSFHATGKKLISKDLESLCRIILEKSGKKGTKKTQEEIQKAVKSVLPPVMAEHAVAEGKKMLRGHEKGYFGDLVFQPAKRRRSSCPAPDCKVDIPKYKPTGLKLEDGVSTITHITYPKAKLDQSVIGHIATDVNGLLSAIIKKVKDNGVKKVSPEAIKKAVAAIIEPATLKAHAVSEGEKMVTLYEMEKIMFLPKKRKV